MHRAARIAAVGHGGQVLVSSATAPLVEVDLTDLGEHRLKDLSAPERIYQLGGVEFPPLKSLYHSNLPIPTTAFVGRDIELADVVELLRSHNVRLLTLTGPGGTGKTRLALQAAGAAADAFEAGVWWVPLAPLRDPELVLQTAAQAIGSKDGLAQHIGEQSLLLLFDNFEHVIEAASGLSDLLAACPNLRLIATSREPLHVSGEQEYPVPRLAHREAVQLFTARARAVKPDFKSDEAVSEICRRLDDLPLALELAAARVKLLPPAKLLDRLERRLPLLTRGARDAPERQQTLRATLDWSFDLLEEEEQQLFARMSVFAGGCTLEAAEDVCEATLDGLASLMDKSLLAELEEVGEPRFFMLETVREYALERIEERGEPDELQARHAAYYARLVADYDPDQSVTASWLDRVKAEYGNVAAALDWLGTSGDGEVELGMAVDLYRFWAITGMVPEGSRRLRAAMKRSHDSSAALMTKAFYALGDLVWRSGDFDEAAELFEQSLVLARARKDETRVAHVLNKLGTIARIGKREYARSTALYQEAADRFRALGDLSGLVAVQSNLGTLALELGDFERADEVLQEALELERQIDHRLGIAGSLGDLGLLRVMQQQHDDAEALLRESLGLARELKWTEAIEADLEGLAAVANARGDATGAARLLGAAERLREERGADRLFGYVRRVHEQAESDARQGLGDAAFAEAIEEGRALELDEL